MLYEVDLKQFESKIESYFDKVLNKLNEQEKSWIETENQRKSKEFDYSYENSPEMNHSLRDDLEVTVK